MEHQHQRKVIVKMTETTISISKYKIPILTGIDNYYEWKSETQDAILAMGAPSLWTRRRSQKYWLQRESCLPGLDVVGTATSAEVSLYLQIVRKYQSWRTGIRGSWVYSG